MSEGLRERKKRLMRAQLSSTATQLFLERGFDAVRVAEIAAACGVSEKTVFNYFPTKESLLLDRFDDTLTELRAALADPAAPPLQAALRVLDAEIAGLTSWLGEQKEPAAAKATLQRFRALITSTAGLRAHQHEMIDELTAAVAESLAERAHRPADAPEAQVLAIALVGLWRVHFRSLARALDGTRTPAAVKALVSSDVRRAAKALEPLF